MFVRGTGVLRLLGDGLDVAVDEHTARFQDAPLLTRDLGPYPTVIAPARVRLPKFGRAEESTVLHAVERRVGKKVERSRPTEVDAMVFESLAVQIARVDRDRRRAELEQQTGEPRLEHRGAPSSPRGPTRVGARRDVENAFSPQARERSEGALDASYELFEDRRHLRLARDLAREIVALVKLVERTSEKLTLGT